ncbi:MAG TPA: MASE1 domain-containing protein [Thermoanaerobaculia bacterium]|nr:MASE1 domain-containing protein [Thermoanaerobaculia bacterium]
MKQRPFRAAVVLLAVAALYFACARLGFAFAFRAAEVTTVWPPTGFALAAIYRLRGTAVLGVLLGAFAANALLGEPLIVAAVIAMGNTLEAVAGAAILRRARFDARMRRVTDVLILVVTAIAAPIISATTGVLALTLGGVHPMSAAPGLWWIWWVGDALGALTVGTPLLIWSATDAIARDRHTRIEAALMLLAIFTACLVVFSLPARTAAVAHVVYVFFIWAALRLGPASTATAVLLASAVAVWGTDSGRGPFADAGPERGLVLLQFFMGVATTTGMTLAAVAAQYRVAERALRAEAKRKDEFLAMLGHELRNPLAPILNAVEILDGNERPAAVIRRQTRHLAHLVDDLLDLSRINSGKIRLERTTVSLGEIVSNAADIWRHLIEQHRQSLTIDLPPLPVWLDADPARMTQVIANLLHNASKFTPEEGRICITASVENGSVAVTVRDTGAGMTPEMLESAFELFVQGSPAVHRPLGGLGLGLTLARQLAELHGGALTATSAGPGLGSELTLRLDTAGAPQLEERPAAEPASPRGRRILVVEDNADAREMLLILLRRDGHDVKAAADGPSALIEAARFAPEIVLLDIGLPLMDGYALAKRLRALPQTAGAKLIALTGYGQPEDRERSVAAGIDHHVLKPIGRRALIEIIDA